MTRAGAYLAAAARSLRTMQLPMGELSSVRCGDDGETYYAPAPLLSALAYDALAFVDPRSPRFVGRVRDLVPQSFFVDVVSLRWGLRLYLASEQSADGTWQLHGRLGTRGADAATTACAAIAMLPNTKWRRPRADRRPLAALQRLRVTTKLEAAHAARYCTLIGADAAPFLDQLQGALSIEEAHAIASTGLVGIADIPEAPKNTLADALRTAALLDCSIEEPRLDLINDPAPPSDPYANHRIASPAAALAIRIGNVARMAALPYGEDAA
ncbi:MAG TPA: hypothetical protein VM733_09430 [Thermoanaerobaculia bacterium]|nr:hypothetical protein [Thermoanaerobaculia bacterium]